MLIPNFLLANELYQSPYFQARSLKQCVSRFADRMKQNSSKNTQPEKKNRCSCSAFLEAPRGQHAERLATKLVRTLPPAAKRCAHLLLLRLQQLSHQLALVSTSAPRSLPRSGRRKRPTAGLRGAFLLRMQQKRWSLSFLNKIAQ